MAKKRNPFLVLLLGSAVPLFILLLADRHGQEGFPLDDAWIHMVYGRPVVQKGYLAYNDGIASTGCTPPLWAYLGGIIHLLFHRLNLIIWGTEILGIILILSRTIRVGLKCFTVEVIDRLKASLE
ncbi:MAG: hypothetical protein ACUVR0_09195 [Candidatus Aminicenantales bacterium]